MLRPLFARRFPVHATESVQQLAKLIEPVLSRLPGADSQWVAQHFIGHGKRSYLVIPNLYGCDPNNEDEGTKAVAMNQLAILLVSLGLIRRPRGPRWWLLRKGELDQLKAEERAASDTDLSEIRKN